MDKLKYMYGRFVGAVAEGRSMKKDEVDNIGRGHVWSGARAKDIKLVDQFGGLGDAIDEAKKRMGLGKGTRVALVELPALPTGILGQLGRFIGVERLLHERVGVGEDRPGGVDDRGDSAVLVALYSCSNARDLSTN